MIIGVMPAVSVGRKVGEWGQALHVQLAQFKLNVEWQCSLVSVIPGFSYKFE
jgi:hypothetical protein